MKVGDVLNGANLLWAVSASVIGIGASVYSDVQMLKVENQRLQAAIVEQSTIKTDVEVLKVTTNELRQNVIYLNTNLKEATDKMNQILIKMERVVDGKDFKK